MESDGESGGIVNDDGYPCKPQSTRLSVPTYVIFDSAGMAMLQSANW